MPRQWWRPAPRFNWVEHRTERSLHGHYSMLLMFVWHGNKTARTGRCDGLAHRTFLPSSASSDASDAVRFATDSLVEKNEIKTVVEILFQDGHHRYKKGVKQTRQKREISTPNVVGDIEQHTLYYIPKRVVLSLLITTRYSALSRLHMHHSNNFTTI